MLEFKDLKRQYDTLKNEIDDAIYSVVRETNFISGKPIGRLEKELAEYVGTRFCVGCGNGTDALSLALMVWGVGAGDAVFVPDFTFFASGEVVAYIGATPIFVDVEEETYNIDCRKLEKAIIETFEKGKLRPKVILAVDLFGQPADFEEIHKIAEKYGLKILEDGAQGFGGMLKGKRACSLGDISTTSFFPVKPLGCYGDGGAIFLNDEAEEKLVRSYQNHGKGGHKYDNVRIGVNSRLDTLQAAILQVKFKEFRDSELQRINELAQIYNHKLEGIVGIPRIKEGAFSSWAQYTVRLPNRTAREGLHEYLGAKGIPSMIYYPKPMHKQLAFEDSFLYYKEEDYEVTNKLCDTVLSLPLHPYMKEEDLQMVIETIKRYLSQ